MWFIILTSVIGNQSVFIEVNTVISVTAETHCTGNVPCTAVSTSVGIAEVSETVDIVLKRLGKKQ